VQACRHITYTKHIACIECVSKIDTLHTQRAHDTQQSTPYQKCVSMCVSMCVDVYVRVEEHMIHNKAHHIEMCAYVCECVYVCVCVCACERAYHTQQSTPYHRRTHTQDVIVNTVHIGFREPLNDDSGESRTVD
jgi:hypothetical protein